MYLHEIVESYLVREPSKKIIAKRDDGDDVYFILLEGSIERTIKRICKVGEDGYEYPFIPTMEELIADNWIIMED